MHNWSQFPKWFFILLWYHTSNNEARQVDNMSRSEDGVDIAEQAVSEVTIPAGHKALCFSDNQHCEDSRHQTHIVMLYPHCVTISRVEC